jgi:hypothetical protein
MGLISLTLPNDGETVDAADVNTPFNTIATTINGNIENANIKSDAAIDGTKIADNSIPTTKMKGGAEGWTGVANNPNTVTYNGNRNYDLVFNSVDLSNTLSTGQRLKLTRTVAAPTQCTDLESGSSQYFNKTSPAGMTFTDDFVVSAWIKLESYGNFAIASRWDGTSGWIMNMSTAGQINLTGLNAGAANYSQVTSYASVPLNKWVHITAQLDMSAFANAADKSYIMFDGVDVPSSVARAGTNPTSLLQGSGSLNIGAQNGANYFDGKIAQVAIFNAKVTQVTMRTYISQGLSGSETSLISAYSFNNSINDLNTTNANNLTPQGSAVATNADSPYANAVTAGLEEYAEINSVTFSTNTTVNVRVPETCMIPTSGGVSNVYYAVGANPYGLPYFSKVLAETRLGSSTGTTSSATYSVINGMLVTFYAPKDSKIKISYRFYGVTNNTAGNSVFLQLYQGTTASGAAYGQTQHTPYSNTVSASLYSEEIFILSAGSYTFNLSWSISPGGTASFSAGAPQAMPFVRVELV